MSFTIRRVLFAFRVIDLSRVTETALAAVEQIKSNSCNETGIGHVEFLKGKKKKKQSRSSRFSSLFSS